MSAVTFNITKKPLITPYKMMLYGAPGCGKSSLAAHAPAPFFFALEKGCEKISKPEIGKFTFVDDAGTEQVHLPKDWAEMLAMMAHLSKGGGLVEGGYKTVVIDSGMFVDKLMFAKIIKDEPMFGGKEVTSVSEYGFATGYGKVVSLWDMVVLWADKLNALGIDVIFIAHAAKINHNDGKNDYKRLEPDLSVGMGGRHSVSDFLCARCDHVLYMESHAQTEKKKGYMNKEVDVPISGKIDAFNRPEIKLYTRGTNRFIAKVRVVDYTQVKDVYDIDIDSSATSFKLFEDLRK